MSWAALIAAIEAEAGLEAGARIEARCRRELAGIRVTICARVPPTADEIDKALRQAGHNIGRAARALGVSTSSLYRALNSKIAKPKLPPPAIR